MKKQPNKRLELPGPIGASAATGNDILWKRGGLSMGPAAQAQVVMQPHPRA